jgi:hypothetical protein
MPRYTGRQYFWLSWFATSALARSLPAANWSEWHVGPKVEHMF